MKNSPSVVCSSDNDGNIMFGHDLDSQKVLGTSPAMLSKCRYIVC